MAIDLLSIEPHKVSRDLSGYITYIYGKGGVGKTTLAVKSDKALLLATEKGYNAIPGIFPVDITSWSEIKQVLRDLKKPAVKERYKTVIVDTVDLAAAMCEKYVCSQNDVEKIGEIPYGQGWTLLKREFEDTFRAIAQLGYALFFISHEKDKTFKREDGTEYNQTIPTCSSSCGEIVKNMVDIMAYAHQKVVDGVPKRLLTFRSLDGSVDCKSRFKYMPASVELGYDNLVNALNEAIDKEALETNNEFITNEKISITAPATKDFNSLMTEFQEIAQRLMSRDSANSAKITATVEKYLGKGKKLAECTERQIEVVDFVVDELKSLL